MHITNRKKPRSFLGRLYQLIAGKRKSFKNKSKLTSMAMSNVSMKSSIAFTMASKTFSTFFMVISPLKMIVAGLPPFGLVLDNKYQVK